MDSDTANRNVNILLHFIEEQSKSTKEVLITKKELFQYISNLTERTFRNSIEWFSDRYILEKVGGTNTAKYKLHSDFKFKKSKTKEKLISQCKFIVGQLGVFSDELYDNAKTIYEDIVFNSNAFEFVSTIDSNVVKNTLSTLLVHSYNKEENSDTTYALLQYLIQTKTPFEIDIHNDTMDIKLQNTILKKIEFKTDSLSLKLKNAAFTLQSLSDIRHINIPIPKEIYSNIDKTLEYLTLQLKDETITKLIYFINIHKVDNEIFFQNLTEEK